MDKIAQLMIYALIAFMVFRMMKGGGCCGGGHQNNSKQETTH